LHRIRYTLLLPRHLHLPATFQRCVRIRTRVWDGCDGVNLACIACALCALTEPAWAFMTSIPLDISVYSLVNRFVDAHARPRLAVFFPIDAHHCCNTSRRAAHAPPFPAPRPTTTSARCAPLLPHRLYAVSRFPPTGLTRRTVRTGFYCLPDMVSARLHQTPHARTRTTRRTSPLRCSCAARIAQRLHTLTTAYPSNASAPRTCDLYRHSTTHRDIRREFQRGITWFVILL